MKKSGIIVAIIVIVIIAVLAAFVVNIVMDAINESNLEKSKERVAITASDFSTIMSQKGYSVQEESTKQVYIATKEDGSYTVEFYELTDEDQAVSVYKEKKDDIDSSVVISTSEVNTSGNDYTKHTVTANGKYMAVIQVKNTVLYLTANDSSKNDAKDLLDELGY